MENGTLKDLEHIDSQGSAEAGIKAEIHALKALIGLRCDAVFHVGADMRVVDSDPKLEELLGPMKNKLLEDRIVANHDGFKQIVSPLVAAPLSQGNNAVLVPSLTFSMKVGDADHKLSLEKKRFEADVLIADSGMWHGTGKEAWRYLVALQVISMLPASVDGDDGSPDSEYLAQMHHQSVSECSMYRSESSMNSGFLKPNTMPSSSKRDRSHHKDFPDTAAESKRDNDNCSNSSRSSNRSLSWEPSLGSISENDLVPTPEQTRLFGMIKLLKSWQLEDPMACKEVASDTLEQAEKLGFMARMERNNAAQCPGCLALLDEGEDICPICGDDDAIGSRVKSTRQRKRPEAAERLYWKAIRQASAGAKKGRPCSRQAGARGQVSVDDVLVSL